MKPEAFGEDTRLQTCLTVLSACWTFLSQSAQSASSEGGTVSIHGHQTLLGCKERSEQACKVTCLVPNLCWDPYVKGLPWRTGMEASGTSREAQLDFVNEVMADVRAQQQAARASGAPRPAVGDQVDPRFVRDLEDPDENESPIIKSAREQMLKSGSMATLPTLKSVNEVSCSWDPAFPTTHWAFRLSGLTMKLHAWQGSLVLLTSVKGGQ